MKLLKTVRPQSYWMLCLLALHVSSAHAATSVENAIERAAREQLSRHAVTNSWSNPQFKLKLAPQRGALPSTCPTGAVIEALDVKQPARMRFAALCDSERAEVIVRATITADAVVVARDSKAGQTIDPSALTLERRDITATPGVIGSIDAAVGNTSRRALRAGQLLDRRWLLESVLVKRNAKVTIVARNAGVEVHVAAEALQAGRRGEIISVRNAANGNVIRARVIAENTVEPAVASSPAGVQQ